MSSLTSFGRKSSRFPLFGAMRAILLGLLILVITLGSCLHEAKARIGETLIAFGDQLAAWSNGKLDSKLGHLTVNGLRIHRVTATTPLAINDALDRLEHICTEHGGLQSPEGFLNGRSPSEQKLSRGTYRRVGNTEGVLACIDTERPLGPVELARRLEQFAKTGDLSAVGQLRYVLARNDGSVTSLLILWTDGSVPLLQMFPRSGDAPGRDVPDVPRPRDSDRLLSAADQTAPYTITVYRSRQASGALTLEWYTKALKERGWLVVGAKVGSLVARRGARTLLIRETQATSGFPTTSILELS